MSVDTKKVRQDFSGMSDIVADRTTLLLCDEIDHLRREALNEVAVRAELHSKLRSADHELRNCCKELAQLREQHSLQRDEIVFLKETKSKQLDEIDRLREQVKGMAQDAAEWAIRIAPERNELLRLRERLRPRSIKDEPPVDIRSILVWDANRQAWIHASGKTSDDWWIPQPPAPPQPDAFEEWWREFIKTKENLGTKSQLRLAWDAAIQSTKSHGNAG